MSDRLLRESDVIEAVAQYISCDYPTEEMAREDAELLIGQIPSADRPQGEWIPCKRRLPEEGVVVLVCMDIKGHKFDWEEQRCIEFGRISSERYDIDGTGWEWLNESGTDFWEPDWHDNIIAWMPLPEPWKGADDERR